MPFSVNEGFRSSDCCAWIRINSFKELFAALDILLSAEGAGDRAVIVSEFIDAFPDSIGIRSEFVAAAPANQVHLVMGAEIPERYSVLVPALRALGLEVISAHGINPVVVGVATPTVEQEGQGVEPSPSTSSPIRM
ncbi:hypothetical protein A6A04_13335 [Paramagnetospirillum marisnigri]|uniref:Uncharacterized protein n=2 Tax=Paramagnetospirillum marisnigri TaxID=1285242 RepID=A0A178MUC6_9PROT|nr:hypothetical protein A6A04_13335 [Paramagnetospirillum marisnigri]